MFLIVETSAAARAIGKVVLVETLSKAEELIKLRQEDLSMALRGQEFPKELVWSRDPYPHPTLERGNSNCVWVSGCIAKYPALGLGVVWHYISLDLYEMTFADSWPGEQDG